MERDFVGGGSTCCWRLADYLHTWFIYGCDSVTLCSSTPRRRAGEGRPQGRSTPQAEPGGRPSKERAGSSTLVSGPIPLSAMWFATLPGRATSSTWHSSSSPWSYCSLGCEICPYP